MEYIDTVIGIYQHFLMTDSITCQCRDFPPFEFNKSKIHNDETYEISTSEITFIDDITLKLYR